MGSAATHHALTWHLDAGRDRSCTSRCRRRRSSTSPSYTTFAAARARSARKNMRRASRPPPSFCGPAMRAPHLLRCVRARPRALKQRRRPRLLSTTLSPNLLPDKVLLLQSRRLSGVLLQPPPVLQPPSPWMWRMAACLRSIPLLLLPLYLELYRPPPPHPPQSAHHHRQDRRWPSAFALSTLAPQQRQVPRHRISPPRRRRPSWWRRCHRRRPRSRSTS